MRLRDSRIERREITGSKARNQLEFVPVLAHALLWMELRPDALPLGAKTLCSVRHDAKDAINAADDRERTLPDIPGR